MLTKVIFRWLLLLFLRLFGLGVFFPVELLAASGWEDVPASDGIEDVEALEQGPVRPRLRQNRRTPPTSLDEEVIEKEPPRPILRHSEGVQHVGLHGGLGAIGYKGIGAWGIHFSSNWQLTIYLGLEWETQATAHYKAPFLHPLVSYTLASGGNMYLNLLAGSPLIYSWYEDKKLESKQSGFNIGTFLGAEAAYFLTKSFSITLGGGPIFFLIEDPYQRLDYEVSLGIRIHF